MNDSIANKAKRTVSRVCVLDLEAVFYTFYGGGTAFDGCHTASHFPVPGKWPGSCPATSGKNQARKPTIFTSLSAKQIKGRFKAKGVRLTNRKNGQAEKKRKESHFVTLTPGRVRVREREL